MSSPQDLADARADKRAMILSINGENRCVSLEGRVTLLDALREHLELSGTKKGCDHGQCGACTVLINGRRVLSCLMLAAAAEGAQIVTIEGLSKDGELDPMQQAFVDNDALQCGYCTPGQILSAIGCVREGRTTDDATIAEAMSGNLCRCGAYRQIRKAIAHASR